MTKSKIPTYIDAEVKKRGFVPSVGAYDAWKADNHITKGTKKSYK